VVNSIILQENGMDRRSITLRKWGQSMHLAPNKKEGYLYTAEQVYEMLPKQPKDGVQGAAGSGKTGGELWDDHGKWSSADGEILGELWVKRFADACEAVQVRDPSNTRGLFPAFAQRIWGQLTKPQIDWRTVLNEFVQLEINDYSFCPPDRRYYDSPFFLPDWNAWGQGDQVSDILFMIDTSASVSDAMMTAAYSEIRGAMEQFGGMLQGWLGFFDAGIIEPVRFETVEQLEAIRPAGGGGTDFYIIFEYVKRHMGQTPPACIIILTDGYAPFPQEEMAMGIPVLWLICNDRVEPPWGKLARITV